MGACDVVQKVREVYHAGMTLAQAFEAASSRFQGLGAANAVRVAFHRAGGSKAALLGQDRADVERRRLELEEGAKEMRERSYQTSSRAKLSNLKEEDLAIVVSALALMDTPPSVNDVAKLAGDLFGVEKAGAEWARRFLQRHGLKVRKAKQLTSARSNPSAILEDCETFAHGLSLYFKRYGNPPPYCVFNADETLLTTSSAGGGGIEARRVFPSFFRGRPGAVHSRSSTIGSLLSFVNAAGELFLSVFVLKSSQIKKRKETGESDGITDRDGAGGHADLEDDGDDDMDEGGGVADDDIEQFEMYLPCVPQEWAEKDDGKVIFFFNRTGYVDEKIFRAAMEHFTLLWLRHCVEMDRADDSGEAKLRALVFADNLAAHHTLTTVEEAMKRNIWLWPLPPNTSHFSQPLDAAPFAAFKSMLRRKSADYMFSKEIAKMSYSARDELARAAFSSLKEAFTPGVIQKAFADTCIYPFDESAFMQTARAATRHVDECDMERVESLSAELAKLHEKKVREIAAREGREVARPKTKKKVPTASNVAWTPAKMVAAKKKAKEDEDKELAESARRKERKQRKREEREREERERMEAERRRDREVARRQRQLQEELEQARKEEARRERREKKAQLENEKEERKRAREEQVEVKEHAKRMRLVEIEEKKRERAARQCQLVDGDGERCKTTQCGAGKGWSVCERCDWRLCPRHSTRDNIEVVYGQHEDEHDEDEQVRRLLEELASC